MKLGKRLTTPMRRTHRQMMTTPRIVHAVLLVEIHRMGMAGTMIVEGADVLVEDAAPLQWLLPLLLTPMSGRGDIRRPTPSKSPNSPLLRPLTTGKSKSERTLSLLVAGGTSRRSNGLWPSIGRRARTSRLLTRVLIDSRFWTSSLLRPWAR